MNVVSTVASASIRAADRDASLAVRVARIAEIDVLRGFVIALMALDHVRDYFHADAFAFDPLDPAQTTVLLYATRWITHLCAPTFVFLAGVSVYLQVARGKPPSQLAPFLLKRGLWLIALELTVLSFGWNFSMPYPLFLQVIWAIGWSMIALAALVRLRPGAVLAIGIAIVAGHNLLDPVTPEQLGAAAVIWTFLHEGGLIHFGGQPIGAALYPILPWVGIMACGYGLGAMFIDAENRDRKAFLAGLAMLTLAVLLRAFDIYGDATWMRGETRMSSAMSFLDVTKYPPSLQYSLMTLGLVFALWPALVRLRGPVARTLAVFGSVPLFFYVLHIYVVHALAIAANAASGRDTAALFGFVMEVARGEAPSGGLGFDLEVVYAAWIAVLVMLYALCRWFARVKARRSDWWLAYL